MNMNKGICHVGQLLIMPSTLLIDGIQRLATGLRSSAIEEVIPFGHEAYIIELNVTKDADQVIYQTLGEASLGIEGGLPLIVGVKRDGEPSTVPGKDFCLMPKDRIAVATSGLGSFSRNPDCIWTRINRFSNTTSSHHWSNKCWKKNYENWLETERM